MKHLILMRHAKSSWKHPHLPDWERPLNKRGKRDAPKMGQRLAERGIEPDLMISSPTVRTLRTAEVIAEEIGYPPEEIIVNERLYGAYIEEWLEIIQSLNDAWECVILFGHNPGLTEVVNYLSPRWIDNVPTCGIVELTYDTETWVHIGYIRPLETEFDYPKKVTSQ